MSTGNFTFYIRLHPDVYKRQGLSRLMNATYGETAGINTNTNRFSENVTAYDKNGNIKTDVYKRQIPDLK